jgi:hypothetical protein
VGKNSILNKYNDIMHVPVISIIGPILMLEENCILNEKIENKPYS